MKLVWKASGCPSFLEMTKSVDLEYNGWSNWGFTFDKFYLPLIQGASNIYLFGTFIRNESGQTKLYQFGGAENDFYSLFLNEEYEGGGLERSLEVLILKKCLMDYFLLLRRIFILKMDIL